MDQYNSTKSNFEISAILNTLFKSDELKKFYSDYNSFFEEGKGEYLNYFGINFKDGNIDSVKFYCHLTDKQFDLDKLSLFIPMIKDFKEFQDYKINVNKFSKNNLGIVLELKYKVSENKFINGFYFNLKLDEETFSKVGFPEDLPFSFKKKCTAVGVNFEYSNETKKKIYYYFEDEESKDYFSLRFKINFFRKSYLIEYATDGENAKLNATFRSFADEIRVNNSFFSKNENIYIDKLNEKYGCLNIAFGCYENSSVKSIYFFDKHSNINPNYSVDSNTEFSVNTLIKIINNEI